MHPSRTSMSCWPGFDRRSRGFCSMRGSRRRREIARTVRGRAGIRVVHVVAHRQPGEVSFTAGALVRLRRCPSMPTTSPRSARPSVRMANCCLWSCDTGAGARGVAFVDAVARGRRERRSRRRRSGSAPRHWGRVGPRRERAFSFSDHARVPLTVDGVAKYEGVDGGHPILCQRSWSPRYFPQCIGHRGRVCAVLRLDLRGKRAAKTFWSRSRTVRTTCYTGILLQVVPYRSRFLSTRSAPIKVLFKFRRFKALR